MSINTAIWGTPDQWNFIAPFNNISNPVDSADGFVDGDFSDLWYNTYLTKAKFSTVIPTLYDGIMSGDKITTQLPLPKDLTFWGINKDCDLGKNWYVTPTNNGTVEKTDYDSSFKVNEDLIEQTEVQYYPFALFYNPKIQSGDMWTPTNVLNKASQDPPTLHETSWHRTCPPYDSRFAVRETTSDIIGNVAQRFQTIPVMDFDYRTVYVVIGYERWDSNTTTETHGLQDFDISQINSVKAITYKIFHGAYQEITEEMKEYGKTHPDTIGAVDYLYNSRTCFNIALLNRGYTPYEQNYDGKFNLSELCQAPWVLTSQNNPDEDYYGYMLSGYVPYDLSSGSTSYRSWNNRGVDVSNFPTGSETDSENNTSADNLLAYYQNKLGNVGFVTGSSFKVVKNGNTTRYRIRFDAQGLGITTTEQFKDYARKQAAYLGFWFVDGLTSNGNDDFNFIKFDDGKTIPNEVHIPLFDNNGITTGEFLTGEDCRKAPNFAWRDNLRDTIKFNPGDDPQPEPEPDPDPELPPNDDITPSRLNSSIYKTGIKYYKITDTALETMIGYINQYVSGADTQTVDFKGVDPWNYVVSCMLYPFDLSQTVTSTSENIVLGGVDTTVQGNKCILSWGSYNMYDYGSIAINSNTVGMNDSNTFISFNPYIKMYLQVPYCGTVELDPKVVWNRSVSVKIAVDIPTGSCTAFIFVDGFMFETIDGNCGMQLPLTTLAMGTYQNTIASVGFDMASNKLKTGGLGQASLIGRFISSAFGGLASGGTMNATSGISSGLGVINAGLDLAMTGGNNLIEQKKLDYSLTHQAPDVGTIGSASPCNNYIKDTHCVLFVTRPIYLPGYNSTVYGHTVGYATCENTTLGSKSGFTVCSDVKLDGINCSDAERVLISNLLSNGVYL